LLFVKLPLPSYIACLLVSSSSSSSSSCFLNLHHHSIHPLLRKKISSPNNQIMLSILHLTAALSLLARFVFAQSDTTPVTGKLGDALIVGSNPAGPVYIATFRNLVATTVRGTVVSHGTPDGMGVSFAVAISGLPQEGGPFRMSPSKPLSPRQHSPLYTPTNTYFPLHPGYHIHDQQVPEDGNCAGTLAHLDPYIRGETPPCNASAPQTCQVGDLSGKHGTATEPAFSAR